MSGKITGIRITHDGLVTIETFEPSLDEFYRLTNSEMIEAVAVPSGGTMYIDEEGKLNDKPLNFVATSLSKLWPGDVIVGDALIVGQPDDEGNDTSVPEAFIQRLARQGFLHAVPSREG